MATTSESSWDEAFNRVESYLRASGVEGGTLRHRVAVGIVDEARGQAPTEPGLPPVTLALRLTRRRSVQWGSALAFTEVPPGPAISLGPMVPEPLEFGFPDALERRQLMRTLWLPARTVMTWGLIVGFFGVAWVASH